MQTDKQPYELLVRWGVDGKISGAHVQWRYIVRDGDVIVTESVSKAEPVDIDNTPGYPLDDIIDKTLQDALATVNALTAERDKAASVAAEATEALQNAHAMIGEMAAQHAIALAEAARANPVGPGAMQQRLGMEEARA